MFDHLLCRTDDIPDGACKGFSTLFVVHYHQAFYVYRNRCPHLGVALEWLPDQFLDRDAEYIQCSTHGALFCIADGHCVAGPCPGSRLTPIPFEIREKSIMINADLPGLLP